MTTDNKQPITTVEAYLALFPEEVQAKLEELRQIIKEAVPEAEELISYQMPGFRFHGKLIWMAAYKNHYAVYVIPDVLRVFKDDVKPYKTSKSAIQFTYDKPVPVQLVTKIVKFGAKQNLEKAQLKTKGKKV